HLDNCIGNVEEGAGTSGHKDGGDTGLFIKIPSTLQKRCDRFLFPADHLLHKRIPYHEVGGGCIFIDQEKTAFGLNALHSPGRLGSTAACVQSRERSSVPAVWQVVDKQGNIYVFDDPPVFGTEFYRTFISDDIFPAIPRDMRVDSGFKRL